ncbi:MAG: cation:proton antiporter [Chloroflexi bacterium]|nr:cation:proton antiporter [Chloroflexota bacterium]
MQVSGVPAVVSAGLTAGSLGPRGMSPTTRIVVNNFWEYTAFLANSFLFLLIGFQIDLAEIFNNLHTILVAILAVLVSRAFVIYLVSGIQGRIAMAWRHILFWGGLRGGVALALALSLPLELGPDRDTVIAMTFGVVLFTLLGQGISMGWIIRRLKIIFRSEGQLEYERRHARALAARSGYDHLKEMRNIGLISGHTWSNISVILAQRVEELTETVQEALHDAPELEIDELITARRQELRAQRSTLSDLRHEGVISDKTHEVLIEEIDVALETGVEIWAQRIIAGHISADVEQVFFAIIRAKQLEETLAALAAQ